MIDNFSIILSTVACVFIIYRAVQLDRVLPWFGTPRPDPERDEVARDATWVPPW